MPWEVYKYTGDVQILRLAFHAQTKLLGFWMQSFTDGLFHRWGADLPQPDSWNFLGDWLSPHGSEPSNTEQAQLFNNCYVLYCTRIVAKVAKVLGQSTSNYTKSKWLACNNKVLGPKHVSNPA